MGYHITSIKLVQMLYSAFPTFQSQPEPRGNINSTIDSDQGKTSCYNRQNILAGKELSRMETLVSCLLHIRPAWSEFISRDLSRVTWLFMSRGVKLGLNYLVELGNSSEHSLSDATGLSGVCCRH